MRVAGRLLVEGEEFSQFAQREVALHVLLLVHHAAAQGFLVGLPLEDLLLDCPGLPDTQTHGSERANFANPLSNV